MDSSLYKTKQKQETEDKNCDCNEESGQTSCLFNPQSIVCAGHDKGARHSSIEHLSRKKRRIIRHTT